MATGAVEMLGVSWRGGAGSFGIRGDEGVDLRFVESRMPPWKPFANLSQLALRIGTTSFKAALIKEIS